MLEDDYSDGRAYAQSKLAQIMFTFDLAEDLAGSALEIRCILASMDLHDLRASARGAAHPELRFCHDGCAERGNVRSDGGCLGTARLHHPDTGITSQAYDEQARKLSVLGHLLSAPK